MHKEKRVCLCGKEFFGHKFCSIKCVYRFGARKGIPLSLESRKRLSIKYMGSGSPSWKGGVSKSIPYKRKWKRDWRNRQRKTVVDFYGGKCVCCGESEYKFLAIDHINNDGNIHRKTAGLSHLHQIVINEGMPKDKYQILCHNCNFAKSHWNGCPHQVNK